MTIPVTPFLQAVKPAAQFAATSLVAGSLYIGGVAMTVGASMYAIHVVEGGWDICSTLRHKLRKIRLERQIKHIHEERKLREELELAQNGGEVHPFPSPA